MSIFTTFFKEDKAAKLIFPGDFESTYVLETQNRFTMGKENPPLELSVKSEVILKQSVISKNIISHIHLVNVSGSSKNSSLNPHLQHSFTLAGISRDVVLRRNMKGQISDLENHDQLSREWNLWKNNKAREIIPDEKQREKFIINYEQGLENFEEFMKRNLQYMLLLPECFQYKIYFSDHGEDISSFLQYSSRVVDELTILYRLEKKRIEKTDPVIFNQESIIENQGDILAHLKEFYKNHITVADESSYKFLIQTKYELNKNSGEIKTAELKLTEEIHENLKYEMFLKAEKKV